MVTNKETLSPGGGEDQHGSCLQTSTHVPWYPHSLTSYLQTHTHTDTYHTHTHIHTNNIENET